MSTMAEDSTKPATTSGLEVSACALMARQPFPILCPSKSVVRRRWGNPGGKNYKHVEYSPDFYKFGSTVPAAIFSKSFMESRAATFIPVMPTKKARDRLTSLCATPPKTWEALDREEVARLDRWVPAPPLIPADSGSRRSVPSM